MQAKSTTHPADRYCSNCRQMVRPKADHNGLIFLVTVLIGAAGFAYYNATGDFGQALAVSLLAVVVATLIVVPLTITRSCPICGTAALTTTPPE